jgi:hypothetical protein
MVNHSIIIYKKYIRRIYEKALGSKGIAFLAQIRVPWKKGEWL